MPAQHSQSPELAFDPAILAQLACPACRGDLSLEASHLDCEACGRSYPIVDGIPVLIAEPAHSTAPLDDGMWAAAREGQDRKL